LLTEPKPRTTDIYFSPNPHGWRMKRAFFKAEITPGRLKQIIFIKNQKCLVKYLSKYLG
jgi:hypothetical protein